MEFSRQKYWSGLLFPSPGDLPNPGVEPRSLALQADSLPSESYNIFSTLLPPYRSGLFMSFHSTVLFVFVCWPPDNNSRKKKKREGPEHFWHLLGILLVFGNFVYEMSEL